VAIPDPPDRVAYHPVVLIDRYMPEFDVHERHHILVDASPERTYDAIRRLDLSRSRVIRSLLAARRLPLLVRRRDRRTTRSLTIDDLARGGFVVLEEEPGTEIVLGLVGRFWKVRSYLRRIGPQEFVSYQEPGVAKAAWNFRVEPISDGRSVLITETRVQCPDDATRRSFALYWAAIGPFSAVSRRRALALAKADAEGHRSPPG
jgi:hypothetical protein